MPLNNRKRAQLEQEREREIQQQLSVLKEIIHAKKDNPQALHDAINNNLKSYKSDALELAYNYMRENNYDHESAIVVGKLFHTRMIGEVKIDRDLHYEGRKESGSTTGGRYKKNAKNDQDINELKQDKTILLKQAQPEDGKGEEICEYLGSNLAIAMMGSKLSPKIRLHKRGDENHIASTFIKGFKTFADKVSSKGATGFGRFLAREYIIGNIDLNLGNVGITDIDGKRHWTGIDDGFAFCYSKKANLEQTIGRLQLSSEDVYHPDLFKGAEFACDLNNAVKDVDLDIMRHIIKESMKNLKIAYGEHFLEDEKISQTLCQRMGLKPPLTEKIIEENIIQNIKDRTAELQKHASKTAALAIDEALKTNDTKSMKYLAKHMPELRIENMSALKYYISKSDIDSTIKLVKSGFKINENEIVATRSRENSVFDRLWQKNDTENDQLRKAIIGDKVVRNIDLKTKPSLLYLAIETGQQELAVALINKGYQLKSSELNQYNKQEQASQIKLSLMANFGRYNESDRAKLNALVTKRVQSTGRI